jgi:peptide deformylase
VCFDLLRSGTGHPIDRGTSSRQAKQTRIIRENLLDIIEYPHPALRHKSKALRRVDADLRATVSEMFSLMYAAKGIGLAANQVDLPYRMFVINLGSDRGEDDELVFINPILSRPKAPVEEEDEGCLSLPGLYAPVRRPSSIHVDAFNLEGEEICGEFQGLLARVIQHETDHLDGVMFIDRLSDTAEMGVRDEIAEFHRRFEQKREAGEIPSDAAITQRLKQIETVYC